MKIQIASDLHLEMRRNNEPEVHDFHPAKDRDVLVLAGDIGTYMNAWRFIEQELKLSSVIYVPGNHEYYSRRTREHINEAWSRRAMQNPGLHYLIGEAVTIGGVRFWGAPWYSDLFGKRDRSYLSNVEFAISDFSAEFNDCGYWTIVRHLEEHALQTRLLQEQSGQVDVVITHWPPTRHATAPRFEGDELNAYFVNDNERLVREIGAQAWISGHVHDAFDAMVGDTRVIGNPTGYPFDANDERGLFRPDRVIEVRRG